MTTTERAALRDVETSGKAYPGTKLAGWLTTTDHKRIGALYLITSFSFFLLAGVLALIIRAELARPGLQIVNEEARTPATAGPVEPRRRWNRRNQRVLLVAQ